ncbi:hypothetical protein KY285_010738 [Solanum tuberosum]|nr:hypothetical protein KY285_010738 [Solanum tuberosum]
MQALIESGNNKKSWADEVEDEANELGKKKSIWDDFDIAKLANAGYKLEYVTRTKKGEIVEIEMEDIRSEITYWSNIVVCYKFGAHPHFTVIQGYIQRKREPLQGGIFHFDNKQFTVKEWTLELEFTKEELQIVPIWKPMMVDHNTKERNGLNFVRILVEVEMGTQVLVVVKFKNEKGRLVEQHKGPKPVQIPPKQGDGQRGGNTQKWQAKAGAQVAQQLQTQ